MTTQQPSKRVRKPKDPPTKIILPQALVTKLEETPHFEITAEQREAERQQEENERRQTSAMAFAVQQLTTPITPAPQEAIAAEQATYEQKLAELQKEYGVQPASHPTKQMRNGITRPNQGTITGVVWATADELTLKNQRPATIAEVKMHPNTRSINENTIKTQYARWRQYNSITGRINPTQPMQKVMTHDGNP